MRSILVIFFVSLVILTQLSNAASRRHGLLEPSRPVAEAQEESALITPDDIFHSELIESLSFLEKRKDVLKTPDPEFMYKSQFRKLLQNPKALMCSPQGLVNVHDKFKEFYKTAPWAESFKAIDNAEATAALSNANKLFNKVNALDDIIYTYPHTDAAAEAYSTIINELKIRDFMMEAAVYGELFQKDFPYKAPEVTKESDGSSPLEKLIAHHLENPKIIDNDPERFEIFQRIIRQLPDELLHSALGSKETPCIFPVLSVKASSEWVAKEDIARFGLAHLLSLSASTSSISDLAKGNIGRGLRTAPISQLESLLARGSLSNGVNALIKKTIKIRESVSGDTDFDPNFTFVPIPAGKFTMGSPETEKDRSSVEASHEVEIRKGFQMAQYELTQGLYEKVMGAEANHSTVKGPDLPVTDISWNEAREFIKKLNKMRHDMGDRYEYSLPSESQWEYAVRAGSNTRFHFGDDLDEKQLSEFANFGGGSVQAVGGRLPNDFGLYDMHGNVWEWVQDSYDSNNPATTEVAIENGAGSSRVLRGGSYLNGARSCRSARRGYGHPGGRDNRIGLRLLRAEPDAP